MSRINLSAGQGDRKIKHQPMNQQYIIIIDKLSTITEVIVEIGLIDIHIFSPYINLSTILMKNNFISNDHF